MAALPFKYKIWQQQWPLVALIAAAGCLVWACAPSSDHAGHSSPNTPTLGVLMDHLPLRAQPGDTGDIIITLDRNSLVFDLQQVSPFISSLLLQGRLMNEPWLLVETQGGKKGWVYAGGLDWAANKSLLNNKRLQAIVGKNLAEGIARYQTHFQSIKNAAGLHAAYQEGMALRDTLALAIEHGVPKNQWAQLTWIEEALPAFIPAGKQRFKLYTDYRQWRAKATASPENADDQFIDLMIKVYPEDSIEYNFPVWVIQTDEEEGHSLLGRGYHHQLLSQCKAILSQNRLFEKEIIQLKTQLLNDITQAGVTYWENRENIIKELDLILLELQDPLYKPGDRIALSTRLKQFDTPEVYGIALDVQSGRQ